VLANPALTEGELRHIVDDSAPRLAFAADRPLQALGRIAADGRWLRRVVDLGELLSPISPLGIELAAAEPAPPAPPADHGAAVLAYTSGTTGAPKAVPLTHANLLSSIRAVMLAWRWDEEDVLAHALPLFHQHGLGGVHATLLSGSRAVIHARLDPAALCGAIAQHGATLLLAVPATYQRLLSWEHIAEADLSSLRLLVSGSAPLSPALAERVQALLGALPLERYGTTESGLDVSNPYAGERRIGTVGLPLPGMELAIVNDDGRPREDGEDGEIVVRGPQVFSGYRGDDHATAAAFYPEGWFRTGDIGRLDPADGYLQITGRAKDLIITGGLNVYPREVELALEEAPSIVRAAVVGVPSERWGEEVVAAAVPSTGADVDPDAVLAFARTRLAAYKCPKRLVVVEELPLNAMGKVVTAEVVRLMSGRGPTR
jgi:malonyl-CoA/methylmalonyl-CoA synthetase